MAEEVYWCSFKLFSDYMEGVGFINIATYAMYISYKNFMKYFVYLVLICFGFWNYSSTYNVSDYTILQRILFTLLCLERNATVLSKVG